MRQIIAPVFLASTLLLSACSTSIIPTGKGMNPCLEDRWSNSKGCPPGTTLKKLSSELVKKRQLIMADPNEYLDTWLGTKLPLHATALFSERILPANAYVEFYSNGRLLTRGELDVPELSSGYSAGFTGIWFDSAGLAAGVYPIIAILKGPDGEVLMQSQEITIVIPEKPANNAVAWLTPSNDILTEAGMRIPLKVGAFVLPEYKEGSFVAFYRDGVFLGKGILNAEGDYEMLLDTSGMSPGSYPIQAFLKSADGETLAETALNDLVIQDRRKASAALINLDGKDLLQVGDILQLDSVIDLRLPVIFSGTKLELRANGELIGTAFVTKDGNYTLNWNTASQAPGKYDLEVIVFDNQGREMARSEKLKVTLEGKLPASAGATNAGTLTLSTPSESVFPGVKVPLKAIFNHSADQAPEGSYVEFVQNGKVIGKGILLADGSYAMSWDTEGVPPGDYPVKAVMKTPAGQVIAESSLQSIMIDSSSRNFANLTTGNINTFPDAPVTLEAMVSVNPIEIKNGAVVEFWQNGKKLGEGELQPDGTYTYNWDTEGLPIGDYPIQVIVKSGIGAVLAESTLGNVTITDTTQNSIELLTKSVSVKPGAEALLQARPTINAVELQKGAYVEFWQNNSLLGRGTRQSDGTYVFAWDTKGLALGDYPIKALLKSSKKETLAQSLKGSVRIVDGQNLITLMSPSNDTNANIGSELILKASVALTPAQEQAGYYVEFFYGSKSVGKGVQQADGTYKATWDTDGLSSITYKVYAVLKQPSGQNLAQSQDATVQLSKDQSRNGGGGGGSSSNNGSNSIDLIDPDGVSAVPGESITLRASATFTTANNGLSPKVEFFVDSVKVGEGTREGSTNNYTFSWDSTGVSLGSHSVTARSVTGTDTVVLVSDANTITLISNSATINQPGANANKLLGSTVVLKATPVLSDQQEDDAVIEFYLGDPDNGGTKLGEGTKLPDGSFTFNWDTNGQTTGSKDIYVRVKNGGGDTLADAGPRTIGLVENEVVMSKPDANSTSAVGDTVPLKATATFPDDVTDPKVEFYLGDPASGGTFLGAGTESPAGTFSFDWDTTGQSTGSKNIYARLKDGSTTIDDSPARAMSLINNDITMTQPASTSSSVDEGTQIALQVKVITTQALIDAGAKVQFYDGVTAISGGLITGASNFVATSNPNEYLVTLNNPPTVNGYDTTGLSGDHVFSARLLDSSNTNLDTSPDYTVTFNATGIIVNVGPEDTKVALGTPSEGPAYLDIPLPAVSFDPDSIPSGKFFPIMPASLDTNSNYTGSDASVIDFLFGDGSSYPTFNPAGSDLTFDNNVQITAYDADFYGETVPTSTSGEFVNRTRAVVKDVTGKQNTITLDTGVRTATAGDTLDELGTADVTLDSATPTDVINGDNFTIDFGSNGVFDFKAVTGEDFDASTHTIQDVLDAINNDFVTPTGGTVSASFTNGKLTINNDPPDSVSVQSIADPVHFVESQIKIRFGTANGDIVTLNNPSDETIATVLAKLNAYAPGLASFDWDSTDDRIILDMTKVTSSTAYRNLSAYGNKDIILLVDSGAVGQGDSETNGIDLGQFFRLTYTAADTYAAANSITDNKFGSADGVLEANGSGIITGPDIDNGDDSSVNGPFEITADIGVSTSLSELSTPTTETGDNSITFGTDPVSQGLLDFFNLANKTDTGTGLNQDTVSTADVSAESPITDIDFETLLTPTVANAKDVSGPLVIDGTTLIADVSGKTMTEIVAAINGFSSSGDREYSASFDGATGKITITVTEDKTLSAPTGDPADATPSGGVKLDANTLTNDTATYTP